MGNARVFSESWRDKMLLFGAFMLWNGLDLRVDSRDEKWKKIADCSQKAHSDTAVRRGFGARGRLRRIWMVNLGSKSRR